MATARARTVFDYLVTSILVACALAVAVVAIRREFFPPDTTQAGRRIEDWKRLARSRPPLLGNPAAPARAVLFSDYQCPFCRDLERKLGIAFGQRGGRMALVRYDLPLTRIHANAYRAAMAARCAGRQGAGRRYGTALFAYHLDDRQVDFASLAGPAGVADITAFSECVREKRTAGLVDADMAVADRLGIDGVPALIVDGKLYAGTMTQEALDRLLDDAL